MVVVLDGFVELDGFGQVQLFDDGVDFGSEEWLMLNAILLA